MRGARDQSATMDGFPCGETSSAFSVTGSVGTGLTGLDYLTIAYQG